ncbi:ABC transporter permease [Cohnella lubricantis]|uniref:ABC transporter permease n=1 Tax=Cohnella lubricantis TaxID=2163172 RepID=A0A841TBN5_9BACL|nr:ABC transporter permease [Cohnella lubricantis]MBB6678883.1 ABC transporter permease [Cohnella lubricantis]MBP2120208.1 putative spermidine/putrescine transport system permease protein [Cohnella lubricantis]
MRRIPWLGIITFIVLLFVISPLIVIIPTSFTDSNFLTFPPEGVSMRWYEKILDRPQFVDAFKYSLKLAVISAAAATVVGTIAALAISKFKFPGRKFISALLLSPLTVPAIIIGIAALIFFTRISIAGTFAGLLLAHILISIPYVVRLVLTGLSTYDYTLERAAYMLGANSMRVFWDITLPLVRPAVLSGFIFSFLTSFDNVTVSLFLVTPTSTTLPLAIFSYMKEILDPLVASISSVVILLSVVFIFLLEKVYGLDRLFGVNTQSHS